MSTYTSTTVTGLSTTTPTEGAGNSFIPELNDAIREIKTVVKSQYAIATKTSAYPLTVSDSLLNVTGTTTITLPTASTVASATYLKTYYIKNTGAAVVTIAGTVDGVVNPTVGVGEVFTVYTDGTSWFKLVDSVATGNTNLITNSGGKGFLMSRATLTTVRALPDTTSTRSGTTVSSDLHLLSVGELVTAADGTVLEVITSAANSFTIDRAAGTDGQWNNAEPQIAAASAFAMDKWDKTNSATGVVLTRKFNSGLLDTIQLVSGSGSSTVNWSDGGRSALPEFYGQYAGKTVTFGAWLTCSTASKARLNIIQTSGTTSSSYHTGGGTAEWIEVKADIAANTITFSVQVDGGVSTTTTFRRPMLVYGSSIGYGNYKAIPNEIVECELDITLYNAALAADTPVNVEAYSSGKIPKNIAGLYLYMSITNNSAVNKYVLIATGAGWTGVSSNRQFSQVINVANGTNGYSPVSSTGDFYLYPHDVNFSVAQNVYAVKMR